jgi:hypothetical protein
MGQAKARSRNATETHQGSLNKGESLSCISRLQRSLSLD